MYWPLYQLLIVISAGACGVLWLYRPVKPVAGFVATAGWVVVSLQARSITVYQTGSSGSTVVESAPFQFFAAGMALLALSTLVLWVLGVYPPINERAGGADITEETVQ